MINENIDLYPPGGFARTWTVYADAARTVTQDLTGWSARAQVRADPAPGGRLLGAFDVALSGSTVTASAPSARLTSWLSTWERREGVWDLVLVAPNGDAFPPLVGGRATLHAYVSAP